MSLGQKLRRELWSIGLVTLYFGVWFLGLLVLKWLVLAEYDIHFAGFSVALVGALILAKVVLILEKVPLGAWLRRQPALVHVLARTGLYGAGVLLVLLLEKSFETRHEYGGLGSALVQVIGHEDVPQVVAAAMGVTAALLVFNAAAVVRRHLGARGFLGLFLRPLPEERAEPGMPGD